MPAAPRPKGKATKLFIAIMGEPANMSAKKTSQQKDMDEHIYRQNTARIR